MNKQNTTTIKSVLEQAQEQEDLANLQEALSLYNLVLNNKPQHPQALFKKGKVLISLKEYAQAIDVLNTLLSLKIVNEEEIIYVNIADAYTLSRQPDKAITYYKKAIKHNPLYTAPYVPCISLMEQLGKTDAAEDIVNEALKQLPENSDIHFLKGKLSARRKDFSAAETSYEHAMALGLHERTKHFILSELAIVKEKLGQYDEAMELIKKGQEYASQTADVRHLRTDINSDDFIEQTTKWLETNPKIQWAEADFLDKPPVFLVGFPRSGTTLMEQILFAHPNLTVTDELQVLPAKFFHTSDILGRPIAYPKDYGSLSHAEITKWRAEYFAGMYRMLDGVDTNLRIVDKNPMSLLYLAVIKRFFPDAPVIMMLRDPRDVCLSCFFQNFAPNSDTIHFYSLEDTAKYYAKVMELYLKFRNHLSLNILEVRYEDLCYDMAAKTRSIIDFIEEPWDDNVLQYNASENQRYIKTPSYEAVSQPINTKAIGKWKHYEKYFEATTPILEPYIKEFGYK